jgi:hypothetical protein
LCNINTVNDTLNLTLPHAHMHTRRKKQPCLSQFSEKSGRRLVNPAMEKVAGQQIRQDCARGAAKDTSTHWTGHREERTGDNTEGEGRTQRAEDRRQHRRRRQDTESRGQRATHPPNIFIPSRKLFHPLWISRQHVLYEVLEAQEYLLRKEEYNDLIVQGILLELLGGETNNADGTHDAQGTHNVHQGCPTP